MTIGATATRKNIASLRGGSLGSSGTPAPASSASPDGRIKLSCVPGVFDGLREDSEGTKTGKLVEVTIIKAGVSLNGLDYLPATLKEAATLFEGVPIYSFKFGKAPGDDEKERHLPEKAKNVQGNVGNMVAQIKEAWWDEKEQAIRGLVAVFDEQTRTRLRNAFDQKLIGRGVKDPAFGLSIDAAGLKEGAGVTKIVRPESVDMVKKAAAGGAFDRIVAEATEEEEDEMDAATITKLVEETLAKALPSAVKTMREQEEQQPPSGGGDPLSALRKLLEGAGSDERKALATRVLAMFREMGLAEASPEEQSRAKMTEAVAGLLESEKDPERLKEALGRLVEENAPGEKDPNVEKLEAAQTKLREMAIGRALDTFKLEDGGTFHDLGDALRLADLSAVKVAEDYSEVTGLTEALTELVKAKPYLVKQAAAAGDPGKVNAQEDAEGGKAKPEPRGQQIHLQEEDDGTGGGSRNVKLLEDELAAIDKRITDRTATDRDLVMRARVGHELKLAKAQA